MSDIFKESRITEEQQIFSDRIEEARYLNSKIYKDYNEYANQPGAEGMSEFQKLKTFELYKNSTFYDAKINNLPEEKRQKYMKVVMKTTENRMTAQHYLATKTFGIISRLTPEVISGYRNIKSKAPTPEEQAAAGMGSSKVEETFRLGIDQIMRGVIKPQLSPGIYSGLMGVQASKGAVKGFKTGGPKGALIGGIAGGVAGFFQAGAISEGIYYTGQMLSDVIDTQDYYGEKINPKEINAMLYAVLAFQTSASVLSNYLGGKMILKNIIGQGTAKVIAKNGVAKIATGAMKRSIGLIGVSETFKAAGLEGMQEALESVGEQAFQFYTENKMKEFVAATMTETITKEMMHNPKQTRKNLSSGQVNASDEIYRILQENSINTKSLSQEEIIKKAFELSGGKISTLSDTPGKGEDTVTYEEYMEEVSYMKEYDAAYQAYEDNKPDLYEKGVKAIASKIAANAAAGFTASLLLGGSISGVATAFDIKASGKEAKAFNKLSEKLKLTKEEVESLVEERASQDVRDRIEEKQNETVEAPEEGDNPLPLSESMVKNLNALVSEISNLTNTRTNDPVANAEKTNSMSGPQTEEETDGINATTALVTENMELTQESSDEFTRDPSRPGSEDSELGFDDIEGAVEEAADMGVPIEQLNIVVSRFKNLNESQKNNVKKMIAKRLEPLTKEQEQIKSKIESNEAKMAELEPKSDKIIEPILEKIGVDVARYKRAYNAITKVISQLNANKQIAESFFQIKDDITIGEFQNILLSIKDDLFITRTKTDSKKTNEAQEDFKEWKDNTMLLLDELSGEDSAQKYINEYKLAAKAFLEEITLGFSPEVKNAMILASLEGNVLNTKNTYQALRQLNTRETTILYDEKTAAGIFTEEEYNTIQNAVRPYRELSDQNKKYNLDLEEKNSVANKLRSFLGSPEKQNAEIEADKDLNQPGRSAEDDSFTFPTKRNNPVRKNIKKRKDLTKDIIPDQLGSNQSIEEQKKKENESTNIDEIISSKEEGTVAITYDESILKPFVNFMDILLAGEEASIEQVERYLDAVERSKQSKNKIVKTILKGFREKLLALKEESKMLASQIAEDKAANATLEQSAMISKTLKESNMLKSEKKRSEDERSGDSAALEKVTSGLGIPRSGYGFESEAFGKALLEMEPKKIRRLKKLFNDFTHNWDSDMFNADVLENIIDLALYDQNGKVISEAGGITIINSRSQSNKKTKRVDLYTPYTKFNDHVTSRAFLEAAYKRALKSQTKTIIPLGLSYKNIIDFMSSIDPEREVNMVFDNQSMIDYMKNNMHMGSVDKIAIMYEREKVLLYSWMRDFASRGGQYNADIWTQGEFGDIDYNVSDGFRGGNRRLAYSKGKIIDLSSFENTFSNLDIRTITNEVTGIIKKIPEYVKGETITYDIEVGNPTVKHFQSEQDIFKTKEKLDSIITLNKLIRYTDQATVNVYADATQNVVSLAIRQSIAHLGLKNFEHEDGQRQRVSNALEQIDDRIRKFSSSYYNKKVSPGSNPEGQTLYHDTLKAFHIALTYRLEDEKRTIDDLWELLDVKIEDLRKTDKATAQRMEAIAEMALKLDDFVDSKAILDDVENIYKDIMSEVRENGVEAQFFQKYYTGVFNYLNSPQEGGYLSKFYKENIPFDPYGEGSGHLTAIKSILNSIFLEGKLSDASVISLAQLFHESALETISINNFVKGLEHVKNFAGRNMLKLGSADAESTYESLDANFFTYEESFRVPRKVIRDNLRAFFPKGQLQIPKNTKDIHLQNALLDNKLKTLTKKEHKEFMEALRNDKDAIHKRHKKAVAASDLNSLAYNVSKESDLIVYDRVNYQADPVIADVINGIYDKSKPHKLIERAIKINSFFKKYGLSISSFHIQAIGNSYYLNTGNQFTGNYRPFEGIPMPDKIIKTGEELIKSEDKILMFLIESGLTIDHFQDYKMWKDDKALLDLYAKLKAEGKSLPQKLLRPYFEIQRAGKKFQDWQFNKMIPAFKAVAAVTELNKYMSENPHSDFEAAGRMIASRMNDDFGGLHQHRLGISNKNMNLYRATIFAADWSISNYRTFIVPFTQMWGRPKKAKDLLLSEEAATKRELKVLDRFSRMPTYEKRKHYQAALIKMFLKTVSLTQITRLATVGISGGDIEDWMEINVRLAKKYGIASLMKLPITPVYEAMESVLKSDLPDGFLKIYAVGGHLAEPFEKIHQLSQGNLMTFNSKLSAPVRLVANLFSGKDYQGRDFNTVGDFIEQEDIVSAIFNNEALASYKYGDPESRVEQLPAIALYALGQLVPGYMKAIAGISRELFIIANQNQEQSGTKILDYIGQGTGTKINTVY